METLFEIIINMIGIFIIYVLIDHNRPVRLVTLTKLSGWGNIAIITLAIILIRFKL